MSESTRVLSAAQVEALQQVDLCLHPGNHGLEISLPGHGRAILDVGERDYQDGARIAGALNPGDVLAYEDQGYKQSSFSLGSFTDYLEGAVSGSPYIRQQITPDSLAPFLEEGRRLHIINPFEYTVGLALLKGAASHAADITQGELQRHEEEVRALDRQTPWFRRLWLDVRGLRQTARETAMVKRLGDLAIDMRRAAPTDRRRLSHIVGNWHGPHLGTLLAAHDVSFTEVPLGERHPGGLLRALKHGVLCQTREEAEAKVWVRHIRRQTRRR